MKYPRPYDVVIYFTARSCKLCTLESIYSVNLSLNSSTWWNYTNAKELLILINIQSFLLLLFIMEKLNKSLSILDSKLHQILLFQNPIWQWSAKSKEDSISNNTFGRFLAAMGR